MSNKSDYNKPRFNIFDRLPEVFQSDTNRSVLENLHNRFLTKSELKTVNGFVGKGNPNALIQRQIQEPTPHRQAFQLQPMLYTKLGTVEHMATYHDILGELERLGVDPDRLPVWGNALKFNWVPPVDIDKLLHYQDYYWYDAENPTSRPQYFTIKNLCNVAESRITFYQKTLDEYGETIPIVALNATSSIISVQGNVTDLFKEGFTFYTTSILNGDLMNKWWTVVSSEYESLPNRTNLTVAQSFTNDTTVQGDIDLTQMLTILQAERDCTCYSSVGWDGGQWDDNQVGTILWNTALLTTITHATEGDWIAANGSASLYDLWYDTTADDLKQYNGTAWITVQSNFSAIVSATEGLHLWDLSEGCQSTTNQWIEQNKWLHKSVVPNFSIAKQAQVPIIEYSPTLEINEWTCTSHKWKYRETEFDTFVDTDDEPTLFEILPITGPTDFTLPNTSEIVLSDNYGDMSNVFVPGFQIRILNSTDNDGYYNVDYSVFKEVTPGAKYQTVIKLQQTLTSTTNDGDIVPVETSQGDEWRGYHEQWLYIEPNDTLPINHQQLNPFIDANADPVTLDTSGDFQFEVSDYAEQYTILTSGLTVFNLDSRLYIARGGTNDIRVYVDGLRQYGTYNEIVSGGIVTGIEFLVAVPQFSVVRIEVGPATVADIGLQEVPVRTTEDNSQFLIDGTTLTSLIRYRREEQVKTNTNQYPLFDMYMLDGTPAKKVSTIFGIREDSSYPVNANVGRRIVRIDDGREYEFEQFLINEDNGPMYSYRDYALQTEDYWYNSFNGVAYQWTGTTWTAKQVTDSSYLDIAVSDTPPGDPWNSTTGALWMNSQNKELFTRTDFTIINVTHTNNLIELNGDQTSTFTTGKIFGIDGIDRVFEVQSVTYDGSKTIIITTDHVSGVVVGNIIRWIDLEDIVVDEVDPTMQTIWKKGLNDEHYIPSYVDSQRNEVTIGNALGDWEIPDQLYYNHSHENRKVLKLSELLTHFNTIINEQETIDGFLGSASQQFFLLYNINYGVGGRIHEFNDSYDTFLSSIYVNNITPLQLIEFAQDQYDSSVNSLKELFRRDAVEHLTSVLPEDVVNLEANVAEDIITAYEQNDATSLIYGDSPTHNSVTGDGIRNWIATLPFFNLAHKRKPDFIFDDKLGISQIIHHDGHRSEISLPPASVENIIQQVLDTEDTRANAGSKLGKQSVNVPPQNEGDFLSEFGASEVVIGVYWYQVVGGNRTLYRFKVAGASTFPPSGSFEDGTLWYDTGTNLLKEKVGVLWIPVTGTPNNISAGWEEVNLNHVTAAIILEAENRLYAVAPDSEELAFDFDSLLSEPTLHDQYFEEAFGNYIQERQIEAPYSSQGIYNPQDAFTWNYVNSTISLYPSSTNTGTETGGTWQDLYEKIYRTPYPHLEPWKLQGYEDKPDWWEEEYADTTGNRRWNYDHNITTGMWENIRTGVIPVGRLAPDGLTPGTGTPIPGIPTYNYFSVNIENTAVDGYGPDELFPPYWNPIPTYGTIPAAGINKSVFTDLSQIVSPNFDYVFKDVGLEEWKWRISSQYQYDRLNVAFRMQPVRFIHFAFGVDFIDVAGLQVNRRTQKVYSHVDTVFHGDIIEGTTTLEANGLNQWYVNFNRYAGFDVSSSDFRGLWTDWSAPLTYQFASFIDSPSLFVDNNNFDVTVRDFDVSVKRSPGISDHWLDSFKVTVLHSPPSRVLYDTEGEWKFQVTTPSPVGRRISTYGVRSYPFLVDTSTDVGKLYQYSIVDVNTTNNVFVVSGDQTEIFLPNTSFTISGSTGNDGSWIVSSSTYDAVTKRTTVKVTTVITSGTTDGVIFTPHRNLPWNTGDEVYISSTGVLPSPLVNNTPYYVIKISSSEFMLAETATLAELGTAIDIETSGTGEHSISQVTGTFVALDGENTSNNWKHFAIDTTYVKTFLPPYDVYGVQNLINLIDGYAAYTSNEGFAVNVDSSLQDPTSSRIVNWQVETERFIDWAYGIRLDKFAKHDNYVVIPNDLTDTFTFDTFQPSWGNGTKVILSSVSGTLPTPLIPNVPYYLIRNATTPNEFQLAFTSKGAADGTIIDITDGGSGDIVVQQYVERQALPTFEINPFRNKIWFGHEQGIISNLIKGPYQDVRTEQTIYDQYGRLIDINNSIIFRLDKESSVAIKDEVTNDVELSPLLTPDPYNYLHLGGIHLFLDGYEHVIMFNNYSTEDFLIYDAFIGLNTPKFDLEFRGQEEFTLRPNVGGYFLQGNDLVRNFEGQVEDLRNAYDTFRTPETNIMTQQAREVLGYEGEKDYLRQLNVNAKSQFVFWRGMIQNKGSVNSVKAFINSRRFIDAKVDEFWAYKIAEYGDAGERSYPEMNMFVTDTLANELKLQFVSVGDSVDTGFKGITVEDQDRWYEFPNQKELIEQLDPLYFDAEVTSVDEEPELQPTMASSPWYYITDVICDDVIITHTQDIFNVDIGQVIPTSQILSEGVDYIRINSRVVEFLVDPATFTNLKVWTLNPAKTKLNPAKVIDKIAGAVITEVPIWDPARHHHYYNAIHLVDEQVDSDPALYNQTLAPSSETLVWASPEVGTTWMDTSTIGYRPYYDEKIVTNVSDRTLNWGKLAGWADINLYQWTQSDVPPDQWDALAESQEGDKTIDESIRKTGRARRTIVKDIAGVWKTVSFKPITLYVPLIPTPSAIDVSSLLVDQNDIVDVYINGIIAGEFIVTATIDINITTLAYNPQDIIEIVRRVPTQVQFDAALYTYDYPHTKFVTLGDDGITEVSTYYFWVGQKTTRNGNELSLFEAEQQLEEMPMPYIIFNKLNNMRYSQVIVRGLAGTVNDDGRYVMRFTRDFTLRDNLEDGESSLDLKNTHTEWEIFRQNQPYVIERKLWDKVTEAIIQETLDGSSRVPSLQRELYDELNNTDTQYGLGDGQTFVKSTLGLATIIADLENPDNDFYPVDINDFFDNNSFDTVENIKIAMDTIYNTFAQEHVNRIYFSVLQDAASLKSKYPDLFKTSMVSLHGIRILETAGLFDE